MITFTYGGVSLANILTVNDITGRGVTPVEVGTLAVPGMDGVHALRKKRLERNIEISFTIKGASPADLRDKINYLSTVVDLDGTASLVFSDEPEYAYKAIFAGSSEESDIVKYGFGTLTFLCPDPFKYSKERVVTSSNSASAFAKASGISGEGAQMASQASSSTFDVFVNGDAPTDPIIELTSKGTATMAKVTNEQGTFVMVGESREAIDTSYEKYTPVVIENFTSGSAWQNARPGEIDHEIGGVMGTYDGYLHASTYGDKDTKGFHGPAVKRSLPSPLRDLRVTATVMFNNMREGDLLGNLEMYLLDENGTALARIGLRDQALDTAVVYGQARVGTVTNKHTLLNESRTSWGNFEGTIQLERHNNTWKARIARKDGVSSSEYDVREVIWKDYAEDFDAPIAQIAFAMQRHSLNIMQIPDMRVSSLVVDQINKQEGTPEIIKSGDKVVFDNKGRGSVRINGAYADNLKHLESIPFKLKPGSNSLRIEPAGLFDVAVRFRDAKR